MAQYPRNLSTVISQILDIVPGAHSVVAPLRSIQSSVAFAAPEMQRYWWDKTSITLAQHFGNPKEGLSKDVADIFAGSN
jgi:hypothetical protein